MTDRSGDWLRQAEEDLAWARDTFAAKRWSHCCFAAQQSAEKALKALALKKGYDSVRSHSITEIAKAIGVDGEIERMAKRLDLYYIGARYPDAFPSGAPFEFFETDQAAEAIDFAAKIVEAARALMRRDGR
jgi:HEPN domain-containing protein